MTSFGNLFRVARQISDVKTGFCNFLPYRGLRFQIDLKWVYPDKKKVYHPLNTGDLEPMPSINKNELDLKFQNCPELKNADDKFKKLFSLAYSVPKTTLELYTDHLVNRVKSHAYDTSTPEVKTKVRYLQSLLLEGKGNKRLGRIAALTAEHRNKRLRLLRKNDYKKFEWILDKLNIEYKPVVQGDRWVTRKKSLMLLVKLQIAKQKEEKIGKLREAFDQQKVPFLEKKLEKLKWIKEQEEKNNLTSTVSDEDIEKVVKQIAEVKIQVEEQMKRGYIRKIHPYFLEPCDEALLREKEQKNCKPQKAQEKV